MKRISKFLIVELVFMNILIVLCMVSLYISRNVNDSFEKKKKIGAVYMTMNNPYFHVISEEIKEVVESKGDLYYVRDSALNAATQIKQIKSLVDQGIDILLVNPVDWMHISEGIEYARDKGVPVMAVDSNVYDDKNITQIIHSDNRYCGVLCAQNLMEQRDSADILLLVQRSNKAAIDRIEGFKATLDLARWPYHIVEEVECYGQLEIAQPVVERILKEGKRVDVVMALNDPSALGAMAALDAANRLDGVLVYGVDGAPEAKTMIYEGRMTASVAQSPITMAKQTVESLYNILEGKTVEKEIIVPVNMITQENIEFYSLSSWQ